MSLNKLSQAAETISTLVTPNSLKVDGRRRPGRPDHVDSNLIPLLRNPEAVDLPPPLLDQVDAPLLLDDLAPARGIILCFGLSVPIWTVIGLLLRATLH